MRSFTNMSLTHFDPLANIRLFEDAFTRLFNEPQTNRPWTPAVDIYETENDLVVKADLPDVDLKDIDVRVENQTLTIAGERKFEKEDSAKGYHRIERSYGSFTRSFAVPNSFDTDKISASFKNGVLSVSLP
ncbi:MAG: Hsp20/alpha crystallin family protein, partial [Bryobacteraceae bacterium]